MCVKVCEKIVCMCEKIVCMYVCMYECMYVYVCDKVARERWCV